MGLPQSIQIVDVENRSLEELNQIRREAVEKFSRNYFGEWNLENKHYKLHVSLGDTLQPGTLSDTSRDILMFFHRKGFKAAGGGKVDPDQFFSLESQVQNAPEQSCILM